MLYEQAFLKAFDCIPMTNLVILLQEGVEEVERNIPLVVLLNERATHEGSEHYTMFYLGNILRDGADGSDQNIVWAISL